VKLKGLEGSNPPFSAKLLLERAGNCRHLALAFDEPRQPALRRELKVRFCRELLLRIPISENLRLQIAREALETDLRAENSAMPVSMMATRGEASPESQQARTEMPH
jgi:hypothetical protein